MPTFEHPMAILAVFFAILIGLFVLADQSGFKGFFKYVPPIVFAYFLPALLTTLGVLPSASELYTWIKTFLLPVSLFLFTMSLDLKTIMRLGWRVIAVMLAGTVGVVLGGPIALVRDGDLISICAEERTISLGVSEYEISRRTAAWSPPPLLATRGVLGRYVRGVRNASEGCVTDE